MGHLAIPPIAHFNNVATIGLALLALLLVGALSDGARVMAEAAAALLRGLARLVGMLLIVALSTALLLFIVLYR